MDKKLGRNFDDNGNDKGITYDIESMRMLIERFSNIDYVMENASLIAALMQNIFNKSQDYNSILFYYVIRKYERLNEMKNMIKNYTHIHLEIYSVFVHPKSILHVPINNPEILKELKEATTMTTYSSVFDKTGKYIIEAIIKPILEKFKKSIGFGLETYSYEKKIHLGLDRNMELVVLEDLHDVMRNSLVRSQKIRCLPFQNVDVKNPGLYQDFQIKAIFLSLNTQYEYFLKSKKYSYLFRNSPNTTPGKTFLSSPSEHHIKKSKIRGHSFTEYTPTSIVECIVCELILWGSYPQGLLCSNCNSSIHRDCRDSVKACLGKKQRSRSSVSMKEIKTQEKIECVDPLTEPTMNKTNEPLVLNSNKSTIMNEARPNKLEMTVLTDCNNCHILNEIKTPAQKPTIKPLRKLQEFYSPSMFKDEKSKKSGIFHNMSMHNHEFPKIETDTGRSKSARTPSPEKFDFQCHTPRRFVDKFKLSESDPESNSNASSQLLINCDWASDDEMKITETFEPEIELQGFPQHVKTSCSSKNNPEYARLLVLMEFHHKTKFIYMILKRFKYLLVDRWQRMGEFLDLFESLSLNCIEELYPLIKSLVETMDKCKRDDTYDGNIAENVYKWLTDDDDKNLQCWLRLSVDLCCTNVLNSVKASWVEHKRLYSKLNELLSVEFNRMKIIEQLANMRPLLFNLPMIVSKIINDLNRFPQYKDEALIWESVQAKLRYLPRFIDERCMPVVKLINDGTVTNSSLKYSKTSKDMENDNKFEKFITHFPKTIFKDHFIDFQIIMITNLRELHLDESKTMHSSVYTREEIEGAAICYENKMIILQKENEKYLLKKFKSINQQKLFPVISFDHVHVTKQTVKEIKHHCFELTILLINQAILVQILFKDQKTRDMWFEHIVKKNKKSLKSQASSSLDCASLNEIVYNEDIITDYATTRLTLKSILDNLEGISSGMNSTLDLISKDLFSQMDKEENLKNIIYHGPDSLNAFFFGYLKLLRDYTNLGVEMVGKSLQVEPTILLQDEIVSSSVKKLQNLNARMHQLVNSQDQTSDNSFNEEDLKNGRKMYRNIQEYIDEILCSAKEKVVVDWSYLEDVPHKLTRQDTAIEDDN